MVMPSKILLDGDGRARVLPRRHVRCDHCDPSGAVPSCQTWSRPCLSSVSDRTSWHPALAVVLCMQVCMQRDSGALIKRKVEDLGLRVWPAAEFIKQASRVCTHVIQAFGNDTPSLPSPQARGWGVACQASGNETPHGDSPPAKAGPASATLTFDSCRPFWSTLRPHPSGPPLPHGGVLLAAIDTRGSQKCFPRQPSRRSPAV